MIADHDVIGNARPYIEPSPTDPAPADAVQFDLPQEDHPASPAFILIFRTVQARVRAQFAYPQNDDVGGNGRLIWSLDHLVASDAAGYELTLGALTRGGQPCGSPES